VDDLEQPGGSRVRVCGGFWCGGYGGLYGANSREDREGIVTNLERIRVGFRDESVMNTVETMMTSSMTSLVGPECQS